MSSYTTLLGAEAVERAGQAMTASAEKMKAVVSDMDFSLSNHQRFLNDWLDRLQSVLEDALPIAGEPIDVRVVNDDAEDPPAIDISTAPTIPAGVGLAQEGPID